MGLGVTPLAGLGEPPDTRSVGDLGRKWGMEVVRQGRNWGPNPCPSLVSHSQSSEDLGLWFPLCLLWLIIPWEGEKTWREKEGRRQKE